MSFTNTTIPGYLSYGECIFLSKIVSKYNTPESVGVEIGSLHGRSAYIISNSIPSGTLYCIDQWSGDSTYVSSYPEEHIKRMHYPYEGCYNTLEFFKENTKDCNNIITCRGNSPVDFLNWNKNIDFIFLDAEHWNPGDRDNIDFWLPKINQGGKFIGHDYSPRFPDVIENVNYLKTKLGKKPIVYKSIWFFSI